MRPGRTLVAALLVGLALTALVGGWGVTGLQAVSAEAEQLSLRPRAEARRRAGELAAELAARLEEVRAAEDARPYYEYQNLFHDPRGASQGQSVALSPLARGSEDPLVAVHFQRGADGAVTVPTVNEEVPELSDASRVAADRARLGALRAAAGELAAHDVLVALAEPRVQTFEPDVYAQNMVPNQVYRDVQQQRAPVQERAPATQTIAVRTEPLAWRTVALEGTPHLVAVRGVGTPDGTLSQGFALSPDGLAAWIAERRGDLPARLVPGAAKGAGGEEAQLPIAGAAWTVEVDPTPALAAAAADAHALRRGFLLRVIPVAALALLCGVLVVLLVARAERLARQRSGFAAAAAHELRTPLAGLALYGDMLADGLGDPAKRADYARRVSDEASRLGRVVANVLGFTQLERRSLAVAPRAGDAARLVRDAL
ncbi:MAG TPA: histidine kinase dimerization/phospho-acceptor domain-containing protein, partial [Kofleriaceae bacterium]|nr:histidine kinase dimerization/phospho-acceptor domain-containing protein [Kofleriaceae bacterium]